MRFCFLTALLVLSGLLWSHDQSIPATSPMAASPMATSPMAASPMAASPMATSPMATSPMATSPMAVGPMATIQSPSLERALRIHPRVICGGIPGGIDAFKRLETLGIKTLVCVDGMAPDADTAKRFGIRTIHLPHGYDGVPRRRAIELSAVLKQSEGGIYIHCHHGKHRAPAAAAVGLIGAGMVTPDQGLAILQAAGTSPKYAGLFQSVANARLIEESNSDNEDPAHGISDFPERQSVSPIATAMIEIDQSMALIEAGGVTESTRVIFREQWQELRRHRAHWLTNESDYEPDFWERVEQSWHLAKRLEHSADRATAAETEIIRGLREQCDRCHEQHRN